MFNPDAPDTGEFENPYEKEEERKEFERQKKLVLEVMKTAGTEFGKQCGDEIDKVAKKYTEPPKAIIEDSTEYFMAPPTPYGRPEIGFWQHISTKTKLAVEREAIITSIAKLTARLNAIKAEEETIAITEASDMVKKP